MTDKKHLYWVIGLVLITIILSGTIIWINYNSWTLRFEMDDNTKEAILSLNFSEINEIDKPEGKSSGVSPPYWISRVGDMCFNESAIPIDCEEI